MIEGLPDAKIKCPVLTALLIPGRTTVCGINALLPALYLPFTCPFACPLTCPHLPSPALLPALTCPALAERGLSLRFLRYISEIPLRSAHTCVSRESPLLNILWLVRFLAAPSSGCLQRSNFKRSFDARARGHDGALYHLASSYHTGQLGFFSSSYSLVYSHITEVRLDNLKVISPAISGLPSSSVILLYCIVLVHYSTTP